MKFQGKNYFCLFKTINGVPQYIVNSMLVGHEGLKLDNYQTDKRYLTVYCHLPFIIKKVLHDPGVKQVIKFTQVVIFKGATRVVTLTTDRNY